MIIGGPPIPKKKWIKEVQSGKTLVLVEWLSLALPQLCLTENLLHTGTC